MTADLRERERDSVGRLYRGLVPPLMLEAPKRAVKFAANDFWGKTYRQMFGIDKMTQSLSVLTGCSAGATESVVVVPFELVKIRLQDKNSTYKGPMDVVAQIIKKEGILGMYAGLEPTFWRSVAPSCFSPLLPHDRADAETTGAPSLQARELERWLLWLHLPSPRTPPESDRAFSLLSPLSLHLLVCRRPHEPQTRSRSLERASKQLVGGEEPSQRFCKVPTGR